MSRRTCLFLCFASVLTQVPAVRAQETKRYISAEEDCQAKTQKWRDWWNDAKPKYERTLEENEKLAARNFELERKLRAGPNPYYLTAIAAAMFGAGCFLIHVTVKALRRLRRPLSRERRQLVVLSLAAGWVSIMILIHGDNASKQPLGAIVAIVLYSLPALLFGGILVWWFGRVQDNHATAARS